MMNRPFYAISGLVIIAVLYILGSAYRTSSTTGLVVVKTSDNKATVSVDQAGHRIINLGVGSQRIRLQPGSYEILVSNGRNQVIKTISIQKKTTYSLTLSPQQNQDPKAKYNSEANDFISKYLPFTDRFSTYRVSYSYQPMGGINQPTITITAPNAAGQQAALKWMSSLGYNPSHFVIKTVTGALY